MSAGEYPGQLRDDGFAAPFVEAIEVLLAEQQRRGAIEAEQVPFGLAALEGKKEPAMRWGAHGNRSLAAASTSGFGRRKCLPERPRWARGGASARRLSYVLFSASTGEGAEGFSGGRFARVRSLNLERNTTCGDPDAGPHITIFEMGRKGLPHTLIPQPPNPTPIYDTAHDGNLCKGI